MLSAFHKRLLVDIYTTIMLLILISPDTLLGMRYLPPRLASLHCFFFSLFFGGGGVEGVGVCISLCRSGSNIYRNFFFKRTGQVYLPGSIIGLLKNLHNLSYSGLGYLAQKVILVRRQNTRIQYVPTSASYHRAKILCIIFIIFWNNLGTAQARFMHTNKNMLHTSCTAHAHFMHKLFV